MSMFSGRTIALHPTTGIGETLRIWLEDEGATVVDVNRCAEADLIIWNIANGSTPNHCDGLPILGATVNHVVSADELARLKIDVVIAAIQTCSRDIFLDAVNSMLD